MDNGRGPNADLSKDVQLFDVDFQDLRGPAGGGRASAKSPKSRKALKYKKKKKKKKKAKHDIGYEADNRILVDDLQNDNPFFQNSMT